MFFIGLVIGVLSGLGVNKLSEEAALLLTRVLLSLAQKASPALHARMLTALLSGRHDKFFYAALWLPFAMAGGAAYLYGDALLLGLTLGGVFFTSMRVYRDERHSLAMTDKFRDRLYRMAFRSLKGAPEELAQRVILRAFKRNPVPDARCQMLEHAAGSGAFTEQARELLVGALDDREKQVRRKALELLRARRPELLAERSEQFLESKHADLRLAGLESAKQHSLPVSREQLIDALSDRAQNVRDAAYAYAKESGVLKEDDWIELLEHYDARLRITALQELGAGKCVRAIPEITYQLDSPNEEVAMAAIKALYRIGDPSAAASVISTLKKRNNKDFAPILAQTLAEFGSEDAPGALILAFSNTNLSKKVMISIAESLASFGKPAEEVAVASLRHENLGVRYGAMLTVEIMLEQELMQGLPDLSRLAGDNHPMLREQVMRMTTRYAARDKAKPLLIEGLRDKNQRVRVAALKGVRSFRYKEALNVLADMYERAIVESQKLSDGFAASPAERARLNKRYHETVEELRAAETTLAETIEALPYKPENIDEVFCLSTWRRTRLKVVANGRYRYLVSKLNNSPSGLVGAAKLVVGVVGMTDYEEHDVARERVYVNMWDEKDREPIYAEIDALEIRGGLPLNYDWAVNAVLEELVNLEGARSGGIPIYLAGEPAINENTLRLLQSFGTVSIVDVW